MEDEDNEVTLPEWAFLSIIIIIIGGLTLAFYAGYNTYILSGALIVSVVTLLLIRIGVLKINFKITRDEEKEDD